MTFLVLTLPISVTGDYSYVLHAGAEIVGCGTSSREYMGTTYAYREVYVLDDPSAALVRHVVTVARSGDTVTAGGWGCAGGAGGAAFYIVDGGEFAP